MRTKATITTIVLALLTTAGAWAQNVFPLPSGNTGIGTTTPGHLLEVLGGDINIMTSTSGYYLGNSRILWHNGNLKNVFVGNGVGNTSVAQDGNTLVGTSIGPNLTSGGFNTLMGYTSGNQITTGSFNSFYGEASGYAVTSGTLNSFFGQNAGRSNITGSNITALGALAGFSNTTSDNTFVGFEAGRSTTTGPENTYLGHQAGRNMNGTANTVTGFMAGRGPGGSGYSYNCLYGAHSGKAITNGSSNTFMGHNSGLAVTTGSLNTLIGGGAGPTLTTGSHNTMVGYLAGQYSTNSYNTFIGYHSGRYSTTAQHNTFMGHQAGLANTTGNQNVFLGNNSGAANTTGAGNTAIGYHAGDTYATGSNNTFLGYYADANGNYTNAAAIGNGAVVTASNRMEFGNASVTGCYNASGIWDISDGRFKFNVNENVSGLDFIRRLRPVTYQMNTAELDAFLRENMPQSEDSTGNGQQVDGIDYAPSTEMIRVGFIAQEVEEAAAQSGFVSSIVSVPTHDNDPYAISYAQIVVPLVKAVQEQQDTIEGLTQRLGQLEHALAQMQDALSQCCGGADAQYRLDGEGDSGETRTMTVRLSAADSPVLYQNRPNPFTDGTVVAYYLPNTVKAAVMVFHDLSGQTLREVTLTDRGHASVTLQADGLVAGVYTYSLVADGRTVETRRMVKGN